jgi:hypothetical protein
MTTLRPIPDEGETHRCEFELCGKEFVAEAAGQTMCSWSCVADRAFNSMFDGRDGSLESAE